MGNVVFNSWRKKHKKCWEIESDLFNQFVLENLFFIEDLDSNRFPCFGVSCKPDLCKCSLPDCPTKLVSSHITLHLLWDTCLSFVHYDFFLLSKNSTATDAFLSWLIDAPCLLYRRISPLILQQISEQITKFSSLYLPVFIKIRSI